MVDDDPDNLEILGHVILAQGATVQRAKDAREALEMLPGWEPDVLLLDIEMPEMDGYELLSLIRLHPALRNVPAVAVTGLAHATDKDRAFEAVFEAHLAKPFDSAAVIDLVVWLSSRPRPAGRFGDPNPASP